MKTRLSKILALLVVMGLLAACSGPTPTLPPVDDQATLDAVRDSAIKTIQADMTKNAPTATEILPTNTPLPPTETPLPATDTPVPATATLAPTATKVIIYPTWTTAPTITPTQSSTCSIVEQAPANNTEFKMKGDFDGYWKVKNTSSKTWTAADTDIRFSSGTKFQTKVDALDLKSDVAAGGTVEIRIDMAAPDSKGTFSTTWVITGGGTLCTMSLTIKVVE